MKKQFISFAAILVLIHLSITSFAQSGVKPFTLEDLMKKRIFASASVDGLKSMSDGIHYTTLSEDNRQLEKFSYKTGEKVATILNLDDFPDLKIRMIVD